MDRYILPAAAVSNSVSHFLQVGMYDPFSDDPRFAIQKIVMCPLSEMLVIGGTAGQVIALQFEREVHQQVCSVRSFLAIIIWLSSTTEDNFGSTI